MAKNLIALVILAALVVMALLVFREKPSEEKKKAAAIAAVPEVRLDTIRITRREGKDEDATIEKITLKKKDGLWRMAEPVDYVVVEGTVKRMAEALAGMKVVDVISENKENHKSFEVDKDNGIEVVALEGNTELVHLIVGKSKSNMTFVRLPEKDEVYRLQGYHRTTFNKSVKNLRDKAILKREQDNVKKVTFTSEKGELVFETTSEGEETSLKPVGAEIENFNETKAKGIVRSLTNLSAREFVDEALTEEQTGLGADASKAVVEIQKSGESAEPETVTVFIGKDLEEDRKTYLKTSLSDQLFLVSTSTTDRFKVAAADFARTAEEMKKEEERKKKAAQAPPQMPPGMMGGMGGMGGNQQIPPDVMRKIQAQMAKQGK